METGVVQRPPTRLGTPESSRNALVYPFDSLGPTGHLRHIFYHTYHRLTSPALDCLDSTRLCSATVVLGGLSGDAFIFVTPSNEDSHKWSGDDPVPPPSVTRPSGPSPTLLWKYDASGAVWGVTVAAGRVYARSENLDMDLFALDAASGTLIWRRESPNYHTFNPYPSLVATEDNVYGLDRNWTINGVDGATGEWLLNFGSGNKKPVSTPAVADGVLYGGSPNGWIGAFDANTGNPLWSSQIGKLKDYLPPVVSGGVMYAVLDEGGIQAIRAATGESLWQFDVEDALCHSPVATEEMVYVAADVAPPRPVVESPSGTGPGSRVYALSPQTGEVVWSHETNAQAGAPVLESGVVYFNTDDDQVNALRASDGQPLWRYKALHPSLSSPAVADGVVYTGTFTRRVYALDADTGGLLWSYMTSGDVWASPVVAGAVVYVGSIDGYVYALSTFAGE